MIIDKEKAEQVEQQFKAIYTNKQEAADLNSRNTEMINAIAESLQLTKKEVRLAFKTWSEQFQDSGTDLQNVVMLVDAIQGE